jgi:hypothetical protein
MKPLLPDLVSPSSVAPPGHRSRLILHDSRTGRVPHDAGGERGWRDGHHDDEAVGRFPSC